MRSERFSASSLISALPIHRGISVVQRDDVAAGLEDDIGFVEHHLARARPSLLIAARARRTTRILRISRADIAKKCARFCHCTRLMSTRRM